MKLPTFVREIKWFVVVGLIATGCQVSVALAAQHFFRLEPMSANVAGYLSSVGVSYFGNSRLTFRRPAIHGPQFARFATISLTGLALTLTVVFVATHVLGWPPLDASISVVLVVPASTFLMSKFWAFRAPAIEPAA
jgi:putative flippase GtrA